MPRFSSDLEPWAKVIIDGDQSLVGTVTCYQFRPTSDGGINQMVEVAYIHNGAAQCVWIERPRLERK